MTNMSAENGSWLSSIWTPEKIAAANNVENVKDVVRVANQNALIAEALAMRPNTRKAFYLEKGEINNPHPLVEGGVDTLQDLLFSSRQAISGKRIQYVVRTSPNGKIVYVTTHLP